MPDIFDRPSLLLSLHRALWGEVHPQLRQASIEADHDAQTIRLRFEYDGEPSEQVLESGSCAAAEVIADFPASWQLDEQHVPVDYPHKLTPLAHVAYRRWESDPAA